MIFVAAEPICQDEEGNIIPCVKVIDRIEDFPSMGKSIEKRDLFSGNDWFYNIFLNPWDWWFSGKNKGNNAAGNNAVGNNATPKTTKTIPVIKTTTKAPPSGNNKSTKKVTNTKRVTTKRVTSKKTSKKATTKRVTTAKPAPTNTGNKSNASGNNGGITLDKKSFTMTGFHNCKADERSRMEKLVDDISTYRAAGLYVAKEKNDPHAVDIFKTYFKDESTRNQVVKVFNNVNNMASATAYCEPNTDSACREQAIAWTYLNSREFHVCPAFFKQIVHGTIEKHTSEAASVVLHELTHCFGTDDYAYGDAGSKALPASRASNNADSFRLFAMHSIYYINDKKKGILKFSNNTNIDFRVVPLRDKVIIRPGDENPNNTPPVDEDPTVTLPDLDDTLPNDTLPTKEIPNDTLPTKEIPSDTLPTKEIPSDTLPTKEIPDYTLPTKEIPDYTLPTKEIPNYRL
ncbi:zincin [Anaeromyces robustus]|uniref:Zincin n=1 Tax=Anaeromyces robustus TaxID=1754192 RepID=A0A1Y1X0G1_9FUNG|nr:zincin [Anaeromyces robustus]|eukprot:ORX78824.1 zincin [Anaeromyces robustus]